MSNAADPSQISELESKAKRKLRQEEEDLKTILSEPIGRRFIWGMLQSAGIFRISHVHGDTHSTAFNEGARNMGLVLLGEIMRVDMDGYLRMIKEAQS